MTVTIAESKEALLARLQDYGREFTLSELNVILSSTVKHDDAPKQITFLDMLVAQTREDQSNIAFQSESSTGKSYIPLEIAAYFPVEDIRVYAGASPTSFFHQAGKWKPLMELVKQYRLEGMFDRDELNDEKKKIVFVDLKSKILIFTDMPHWQLLERLRPLLSHDKEFLRYDITDKQGKAGLRTKTVLLRGFPVVVFATTNATQEDQEKTRLWLLSASAEQEKLTEALELSGAKIANRQAFHEWIENDSQRKWLKERVREIRASRITDVVISDWRDILERYRAKRPHLSPRTQRDWPRLLYLVKAHALLNCFQRVKIDDHTIMAEDRDVEAAFGLYEQVATPNELGLSPETYRIYQEVIVPLANDGEGCSRKEISKEYFDRYHRPLSDDRLRRQILPTLESAGLISQEVNPLNKRENLVYCTIASPISPTQQYRGDNSAPPPLNSQIDPGKLERYVPEEGCTMPSPMFPSSKTEPTTKETV